MNFEQPLKTLEQRDVGSLRDAILEAEDGAWNSNQVRQKTFDVHYQTQSLVMLFVDAEHWPRTEVSRESGWGHLAGIALPIMKEIVNTHYEPGGVVLRAMAARLSAGSIIKPHIDAHPSFRLAHRIHIPITTNPRVRFNIGGCPHQLDPGNVYEINNQLQHSVINGGKEARINFIFDYLPPSERRKVDVSGAIDLW